MIRTARKGLICLFFGVFCAGCGGNPQKIYDEIRIRHGAIINDVSRAGENEFRELEGELRGLVSDYPGFPRVADIEFSLAQMYADRKQFERAIDAFASFCRSYPANYELCARAHFTIGLIHEKRNAWDEALKEYQEVIDRYPESRSGIIAPLHVADHYARAGMTAETGKAFENAAGHYAQVINDAHNAGIALLLHDYLINAWLGAGRPVKAALTLEGIAKDYPESEGAAAALFKSAMIYNRAGRTEKAIPLLRKVSVKYPDSSLNADAVIGLGSLLAKEGKLTEALNTFNDFIVHHSSDPSACSRAQICIARSCERARLWDKALEEYRKVSERYPDTFESVQAQVFIARHYRAEKKQDEASALFSAARKNAEKILEKNPDKRLGLSLSRLVAEMYAEQQQWREAAAALEKAVGMYPGEPETAGALRTIAVIFKERLNDPGKAEIFLRKLAQDFPEYREIADLQTPQAISGNSVP